MSRTLEELIKLIANALHEAEDPLQHSDEDPEDIDPEDAEDSDSDTDVDTPETDTDDEYTLKRQAVKQGHEAITTFRALGPFEKPAVEKIDILKDPSSTEREKDDAKAWIYNTYDPLIEAYIKYYIRGIFYKMKRQFSSSEVDDIVDSVKDKFWHSMLLRKHSPPIIVSYDPVKGKAVGKTIDPETGEKLGDVAGFLRGNLSTVNRFNVPKEIEDKLKHVSFQRLAGKGDDDTAFDPAAPIVAIRPDEPNKEEMSICNRVSEFLLKIADFDTSKTNGKLPSDLALPGMQANLSAQNNVKAFMYAYGLGYPRKQSKDIAAEFGRKADSAFNSYVNKSAEAVTTAVARWLSKGDSKSEDKEAFLKLIKKLDKMGGRQSYSKPFCPDTTEERLSRLTSILKEWNNERTNVE